MENKFMTFIKPFLLHIDNGSFFRVPFEWLYKIISILNLVFPIYVLYKSIDLNLFDMKAKFVFVFILCWLLIAFTCWVNFQLWWNRSSKVAQSSGQGDDFVATPVFAHFVQTSGEWLGTTIGIIGFGVSLLAMIILGDEAYIIDSLLDLPFLGGGIETVIILPITGFLIIVFFRFLAEQFRALASIANNTGRK